MARNNLNETAETYEKQADDWFDQDYHANHWTPFRDRLRLLAGMGWILEIGFGSAPDALYLLKLFGRYLGIDLSKRLVNRSKRKFPSLDLRHMDMFDLHKRFERGLFRAFWCAAVLLHIPSALIDEALANLNFVSEMGACGFISVKRGNREELVVEGSKNGEYRRHFTFWELDEFTKVLERNGFEMLPGSRDDYEDPSGNGVIWLVVYVRKVAETTFQFKD